MKLTSPFSALIPHSHRTPQLPPPRQASSGYWEIVRDSLSDLVRIQMHRCYDEKNHKDLYDHVRGLRGQVGLCAFPNLFITIAPAEWTFPHPYFLRPYLDCVFAGSYLMALHMYYLVFCIWRLLSTHLGHRFFTVLEYVVKTEYQGRGTPHWHIACWVLCRGPLARSAGNTGKGCISAFVRFLQLVFHCEIDVQVGNGRLNYINGYVAKDHDAVDVGLGEYVQKCSTAPWLAAYRLLCKSSPCLPEVAIRMGQLSEFQRSYSHVLLYPPQPKDMLDIAGRQRSFSSKMYGFYTQEMRDLLAAGGSIETCFLQWHRHREFDPKTQSCMPRGGQHQHRHHRTLVCACRYWYELCDGYWGQFVLTQIPHVSPAHILPREWKHLECMQNFAGALEYLHSWSWQSPGIIRAFQDCIFKSAALPLVIDDSGIPQDIGIFSQDARVFSTTHDAFEYLITLARRDLLYRGFRDDRIMSFTLRTQALFALYQNMRNCSDDHEYALLRQHWDAINRPGYVHRVWSPRQQEALDTLDVGVSHDDEEAKACSKRWLFIKGRPGSGKSLVLLEMAVRCAQKGLRVLIVCPTGTNVYGFKSQLPNVAGADLIGIDTLHGVLKYKRPGKDSRVALTPPSALRRIDVLLCDEASQFADLEWQHFFQISRNNHISRSRSYAQTSNSCSPWDPAVYVNSSANVCKPSSLTQCIAPMTHNICCFKVVSANNNRRGSFYRSILGTVTGITNRLNGALQRAWTWLVRLGVCSHGSL